MKHIVTKVVENEITPEYIEKNGRYLSLRYPSGVKSLGTYSIQVDSEEGNPFLDEPGILVWIPSWDIEDFHKDFSSPKKLCSS